MDGPASAIATSSACTFGNASSPLPLHVIGDRRLIGPTAQSAEAASEMSGPRRHVEWISKNLKETQMNWDRIEGDWKQLKGQVKEKWGKLTDDDLAKMNGKREQLEGKIQERYGYGKEQIKQELDTWSNSLPPSGPEPKH